jgi:type VI secretion system protein ImpG
MAMNEVDRFYEEELNYLIEAGREYARLHPERARFLNLSDPRARDPHVERLIESFAFLTGRVRQKLEDQFPELTHSLLELIWPHHLRPIPALSLLQFRPIRGMVRERQVIPPGFLVDSRPTRLEVACRFRTAYPVEVYPLHLATAGMVTDDAGQPRLRLRFELTDGAGVKQLEIPRLRLHLAGEPAVAFGIYRLLRTQVDSILLRSGREAPRPLPQGALRAVGFAADEEVLPYSSTSFPGYRLLAEYFAFPEKFMFLDVLGIGSLAFAAAPGGEAPSFELELRFRGRPPESLRPTRDNFQLYVTPIVNVFSREGEPITVTQLKTAHRVLGAFSHPDAYEVLSVDSVEAAGQSDGARRQLAAFYSFAHDEPGAAPAGEAAADGGGGTFYQVTHRRSAEGAWLTYLSLVSSRTGHLPGEEVLSLVLTCTNGRLCQEVGNGEIRFAGGPHLDFVTFGNITRPTDAIYPRLGEGTEWRLVSQMALNLLSLADPEALRVLLSLYDPGAQPANRRRIAGIREVASQPDEVLVGGAPIRGTVLTMTLDETHFDDAGDLLLFCDVLSEFLSLYTSTNSFTRLVVRQIPSGAVLRCAELPGKQRLI